MILVSAMCTVLMKTVVQVDMGLVGLVLIHGASQMKNYLRLALQIQYACFYKS